MTTARPCAVLAMWDGIVEMAFPDDQLMRLQTLVDLITDAPIASWETAPPGVESVEVVVGHWGCPPLDARTLEKLPKLRLFAYAAGSVKQGGTVTPAVFDRGITVTAAAAANAIPVAEYTLAVILLANKGALFPRDLRSIGNVGKRIGVIGASHIGRRLIELLRPFELEVIVFDPYLADADADALCVQSVTLESLLATSDVVSIHAPLTPETEGMISSSELASMKDGAVLINTARGRLLDTPALEEALQSGRIAAVLDVTSPEPLPDDSPLRTLPNVFLTPHIAGAMGSELRRLTDSAIDEVAHYVRGEPPAHPVRAEDFGRLA